MIRPVDMTFAEIVCSRDSAMDLFDLLYAEGEIELENSGKIADGAVGRFSFPSQELESAHRLMALAEKIADILGLEDSFAPASCLSSAPEEAASLLKGADSVVSAYGRRQDIRKLLDAETERLRLKKWIQSLGIDPTKCRSTQRTAVFCGSVTEDSAGRIRSRLCAPSEISEPVDSRRFILAAVPGSDAERAAEILKHEAFVPIDILNPAPDLARLTDEERELAKVLSPDLENRTRYAHALSLLKEYLRVADKAQLCAVMDHTVHVACWFPSSNRAQTIGRISTLQDAKLKLRAIPAEKPIAENAFRDEEVPSKLSPSEIFGPFRLLVSAYACPAYRHIDPTIAGALFFLVFFGMMFADLGHGLVLALAGLFLRLLMRNKTLKNAGALLIAGGAAAGFGGFLFGSVFGDETVIAPLLFHPAAHLEHFLKIGIAIGCTVISTGIVFNIIQLLWHRQPCKALFSQWGLFSLLFYWLCTAMITLYAGGLRLSAAIMLTLIPLCIMVAGAFIIQLRSPHPDLAETAFMPVEIVLGLLSNTVSFVRIAAFGLCHIALMSAVYIIASSGPDSSVFRGSTIIEGNIFVILLEALVVTIQCLRLQFYEFYSKFFSLSGRPFVPLNSRIREGS